MKLRTEADSRLTKGKCKGNPCTPQYRLKRDEHSNCIYTKVGEIDIQKDINSYKNGCSLEAMLERISYMPIHDKLAYLTQSENGFSADVSNLPNDGTEAFIMNEQLKRDNPQLVAKLAEGLSFEEAVKALLDDNQKSAATENVENESEVIIDGTN